MSLVRRSLCVLLFAAVAVLPAAAEDLTVVSTVTSGKTGKTVTATQYLSADKLRSSDGNFDSITDLSSGKMIHVDHKKKEYWETSLEDLRQQFAAIDQMLDENPMMARMLGGATEVTVTKGTDTREVAGYVCDHYSMSIGKLHFELWAARGLKAPAEYHDAQKMVYAAMGPMASRFDRLYEEMKKIEGFPLRTEMDSRLMGFKVRSVSEATEVRKGPIPDSAFDPPAGYKKKKPPYED